MCQVGSKFKWSHPSSLCDEDVFVVDTSEVSGLDFTDDLKKKKGSRTQLLRWQVCLLDDTVLRYSE